MPVPARPNRHASRFRRVVADPSAKDTSLHGVHAPDQVPHVIRRERARADRRSGSFCLVLLRLHRVDTSERQVLRLARVVLRQIRETDEVGRFDATSVCALLPDTDAEGARRLCDRACGDARQHGLEPSCTIYTYPDDGATGGDGDGGGGGEQAAPCGPKLHREEEDDAPRPLAARVAALTELTAQPLPRWKRALDVAVSGAAILAVSPALALCALAIKLTSPGPVIFRQQRTGLGGRPFTIYKFRTMVVNAEAKQAALRAVSEQDGPAFKLKRDPRVTRVGALLRKTSLDELPQLFNILQGDMSLVGPRPLPVREADGCVGWQARRHDVTPGLTCVWQVEGRSRVKFEEWMRMDLRYAGRRRHLLRDLKLIARTIPAVLARRGAA